MVPKAIRDRLGLMAGSGVELTERGGELVLTPLGPRIRLAERGGRRVFVVDESDDVGLSDDDVRGLVEESRQWPHP